MKGIVFDTGPLITLTMNNLLGLIKPLKARFGGEFWICPAVFQELIKKPLTTRKFKFEALQILPFIMDGTIKIHKHHGLGEKTKELMHLANRSFVAKDNYIKIVHLGEMEAIATALVTGSDTLVIDERTTRVLIERPHNLSRVFRKRLHTHVDIDRHNLDKLHKEISHLKVIRSFEMGVVAFETGMLNKYRIEEEEKLEEVNDIDESLLEGVLWAIKLAGCSVSGEDINQTIKYVLKDGK